MVGLVGITSGLTINAAPTVQSINGPARATQKAERGKQVQLATPTASYRVTLVVEWSPETHPTTLPPGWHTSQAVLASHSRTGDLFAVGGFATSGIEAMAERGSISTLRSELQANPTVESIDTGRGIDGSGSDTLDITTSYSRGLLSMVTMLAPSPDWFVGFSAVRLFKDGAWVDRVVLDLGSYDAGTDSGAGFTSGDIDTQPRQPISGPRDGTVIAAAGERRFGYVVIQRTG